MKKLLLISGLLFSGGVFADMDNLCMTELDIYSSAHKSFIEKRCERNNILLMDLVYKGWITQVIAEWCRYDREINFVEVPNMKEEDRYMLTCVLYSNKPRER